MNVWPKSHVAIEMTKKLGRKPMRNGTRSCLEKNKTKQKPNMGSCIQPDAKAGAPKVSEHN